MTMTGARAPSSQADLADAYRSFLSGGYDELVDGHGRPRAHWRPLLASLSALSESERGSRARQLYQRVRETGVTYDIFSDPRTHVQPWQLNLVPLVIAPGEWRWLEAAIAQRARLLSAVLDDVYGSGRLLADGLLAPELVFSDPTYVPAAREIVPHSGGLRFYAADVARGHDGAWRVIDNHTETLAGVGFALANRVTHTHVAGDLFNEANAQRLAPYFQRLQEELSVMAGRENARIALLTSGPQHPDYFSHAYIARYLGLLLVEGNDLRVRGQQVALKTLEGLKEIDLIVRCAEGLRADPLELDPAGFLGPAGLLAACRSQPRLLVNPIGSAVVQNRALCARLGALAKQVFGETLMVEDSPRLWLGDAGARGEVCADPHAVTIRGAQEGTGRPGMAASGIELRDLTRKEIAALMGDMGVHGSRFVAEHRQSFSTTPALTAGTLVPRPTAIRLFAARIGEEWAVMPGGLAMSVNARSAVSLTAADGDTHDVWVLSDAQSAPHVSLWRPTIEMARIERSQRATQSRVAENLFWLGRYAERADWIMRMLRSAMRRVEEDSGPTGGRRSVVRCMEMLLDDKRAGNHSGAGELVDKSRIERAAQQLIASDGGRSLINTITGLYRAAFLVRDRLSQETWQILSRLAPNGAWGEAIVAAKPVAVLDRVEEGLSSVAAFNGLMHENMTRNFGWSFLNVGRRMERAYNLAEAVGELFGQAQAETEEERTRLLLLLELGDSFITYRSRYRLEPMLPLVLDLLILDESNPRSLAYQLAEIATALEELPHGDAGRSRLKDRRLILQLLTAIRLCDIEEICREPGREELARLLRDQLTWLPELSDAVSSHYFNLTDAPQRLQTRVEPRA